MLGDATYQEWTLPFNPAGSRFEGSWEKGSKIRFLGAGTGEGEQEGGMYAQIVENRPHEFVSIRHLGEIAPDGTESAWPDTGMESLENYTLLDTDGGTDVQVDLLGLPDAWTEMMDEAWPQALAKLKDIAER